MNTTEDRISGTFMKRLFNKNNGAALIGAALLFVCAFIVMLAMRQFGMYASGNDIWGHLYKSQLMYDSVREGNVYPLYTSMWYNGIQPYRYWAPLPYYLMTALQTAASGNIEIAYYLFAGVSVFAGGIPWILLARRFNRVPLGVSVALLWFFMPENIRVFYCEGNLPRMVTAILIPWLIFFLYKVLREKSSAAYIGIIVFTCSIVLSHAMIGAMMGVGTFLFLLFDYRKNRGLRTRIFILAAMLAGIALAGIWLVPALSGGLMSMDAEAGSSVMESLMYHLTTTLDPFNRLNGVIDTFYYGLSVVIISIAGIVLADKKRKAGYILAIVVLIMTTPALLPLLKKLPMNQLFWMMRFATIVYGFFFLTFIEWKNMRQKACIIAVAFIVIDCIPSFMITRYDTSESPLTVADVDEVRALTKQRAAIMDLSTYGSYPSWGLCTGEDAVSYTYGWAWQGAATSSNIVLLNTALEEENYLYVFDRCLELGDDTVLIKKDIVGKNERTEADLMREAGESGYTLAKETNRSYIFTMPVTQNFGVKTEYTGIGIGRYANTVSLYYPSFTIGNSVYLDEYTVADLKGYKTIFLSGFEYHDKEAAEKLVEGLKEAGTRVVIDITHIPSDVISKRKTFLGVTAEDVVIEDCYPDVDFEGGQVICKPFSEEYDTWNTAYAGSVKHVLGTMGYENEKVPFVGYNEENIIFLGMNFMFHATQTQDMNAFSVLNKLLQAEYMALPERTTVPVNISYTQDGITILSDDTGVNTTLAYQDNFVSEDDIEDENHLLIVNQKETQIQLVYPHYRKGLCCTVIGAVMGIGLIGADIWLKRRKKKQGKTE